MSIVKYRPDIDGLRALAVLPVVIFHANPSLVPGGFLGVDIFFVISGYLISLILFRQQSDGTFRFSEFYGRRIRRLFPALILVLAASLGFGFFSLLSDEYERLGRHAVFAIAFLLNLRLMSEAGYFDVVSYSKPFLHLWSLSVEEQFYVVWPLLLALFARLKPKLAWLLALCSIFSFAYALWLGRISPDAPYYHPLARFWELLVGAALAYIHYRRGSDWLPPSLRSGAFRNALSLAGLLLLVSALFCFRKTLVHPGVATLWPLAGAFILIATGPDATANRLLALRPLVWVGLISYPLYLWHWPILSFIRVMESGSPAPWMLWSGVALSVALAVVTYRWAELPLRAVRDKRTVTVGLSVLMLGLLAIGLMIANYKGLPERPALQYLKKHESQMTREPRQDGSCMDLFEKGEAPVYCREANPGPRMIVLIGDSHAHVLFTGVSLLAKERGYGTLLLANSGCPPLLGAVTGRNNAEQKKCAQSIENIFKQVSKDKRIVSVVIASRGPQYISGLGFGPVEANYNYPPIAAQSPGGRSPDPERVFMDGLFNTSERLHKLGLRVSYFLQIPELGVPAKDCLGRPLTLSEREGCTVAFDRYQDRMNRYRAGVFELARKAAFLRIIDPQPLFCKDGSCSGFINGQLLYADDNHLSVAGSVRAAPIVLRAALDGLER